MCFHGGHGEKGIGHQSCTIGMVPACLSGLRCALNCEEPWRAVTPADTVGLSPKLMSEPPRHPLFLLLGLGLCLGIRSHVHHGLAQLAHRRVLTFLIIVVLVPS